MFGHGTASLKSDIGDNVICITKRMAACDDAYCIVGFFWGQQQPMSQKKAS